VVSPFFAVGFFAVSFPLQEKVLKQKPVSICKVVINGKQGRLKVKNEY